MMTRMCRTRNCIVFASRMHRKHTHAVAAHATTPSRRACRRLRYKWSGRCTEHMKKKMQRKPCADDRMAATIALERTMTDDQKRPTSLLKCAIDAT